MTSASKSAGAFLLFIAFSLSTAYGQDIYMGAGYTVSYWPLMGLNNILNHYESTRSYDDPTQNPEQETTNATGSINLLSGFTVAGGYLYKPEMNLEFKYMNRRNSRWSSQVVDAGGGSFSRSITVVTNSYGIGVSKLLPSKKRDYILGATVNLTNLQVDVSEENKTKEGVVNSNMLGGMVFMKFIYHFKAGSPLALSFNPYIQFNLTDTDFSSLNRLLNPNTYTQLSSAEQRGARLAMGIEIQLVYFIYTKFNKGE